LYTSFHEKSSFKKNKAIEIFLQNIRNKTGVAKFTTGKNYSQAVVMIISSDMAMVLRRNLSCKVSRQALYPFNRSFRP
jgi:hypothetical protein